MGSRSEFPDIDFSGSPPISEQPPVVIPPTPSYRLRREPLWRYYRVDASRPYFLPVPLPFTGTLGAFIRIRQPFPGKRALFDIGSAGPIAGFLVAIPLLLIGMQ